MALKISIVACFVSVLLMNGCAPAVKETVPQKLIISLVQPNSPEELITLVHRSVEGETYIYMVQTNGTVRLRDRVVTFNLTGHSAIEIKTISESGEVNARGTTHLLGGVVGEPIKRMAFPCQQTYTGHGKVVASDCSSLDALATFLPILPFPRGSLKTGEKWSGNIDGGHLFDSQSLATLILNRVLVDGRPCAKIEMEVKGFQFPSKSRGDIRISGTNGVANMTYYHDLTLGIVRYLEVKVRCDLLVSKDPYREDVVELDIGISCKLDFQQSIFKRSVG